MSNVTGITGNLCNKCPKQLVKQISSYSDYFNVISGFTSNSRAPGGPVIVTTVIMVSICALSLIESESTRIEAVTIQVGEQLGLLLHQSKQGANP